MPRSLPEHGRRRRPRRRRNPRGGTVVPPGTLVDVSALDRFSEATRAWFTGAFEQPTAAQEGAWDAISSGEHALVVAPTGSGKTLAAFLWSLDRLAAAPPPADEQHRCRVLYVSPLKALAVDVERNLRAPLAGIGQAAARLGLARPGDPGRHPVRRHPRRRAPRVRPPAAGHPDHHARVAVPAADQLGARGAARRRDGDRRRGARRRRHQARRAPGGLPRPARRAARPAGPADRPVGHGAPDRGGRHLPRRRAAGAVVVAPPSPKEWDLSVVVPVEDMSELGQPTGELEGSAAGNQPRTSIWPAVEERVLDLVQAHRSTIVFANSRRLAERLTSRLNELAYERATGETVPPGTNAAALMAQAGSGGGVPEGVQPVAAAHHGSVSREQRAIVEEALKSGRLPAVVATSSLELGIDMGAVDLVVQVEAPPTVASGLQRVGRAGHQVGAVSRGVAVPQVPRRPGAVRAGRRADEGRRDRVDPLPAQPARRAGPADRRDGLRAAAHRRRGRRGGRAGRRPSPALPDSALHARARHARRPLPLRRLRRAAAPADLGPGHRHAHRPGRRAAAGRHQRRHHPRPRAVRRLPGRRRGQRRPAGRRARRGDGLRVPGRRRLPARLVVLADRGHHPRPRAGHPGARASPGRCRSGTATPSAARSSSAGRSARSSARSARPRPRPGWRGPGRPGSTSGARPTCRPTSPSRRRRPATCPTTARCWSSGSATSSATGGSSSTRRSARRSTRPGRWCSPPGCASATASTSPSMHSDDGIVLRLPDTTGEPPEADLAVLDPDDVEREVTAEVGSSALFASRFRECAARALLLPRRDPRRRTPLWQQRQRAAQLLAVASDFASFPIMLEAVREVLQDVYDVPGLVELMRDVRARRVRVVDVQTETASPFAQSLLFGYVGQFIYDGDAPLAERRAQALALDTGAARRAARPVGAARAARRRGDGRDRGRAAAAAGRAAPPRRRRRGRPAAHGRRPDARPRPRRGACRRRGWTSWSPRAARCWCGSPARSATSRSRTPAGCATPSAPRCRSACPRSSPSRWPIRSATSSAATPAPTARSSPARWPGGSASAWRSSSATLQRLTATGRLVTGEFRPGGTGQEWCDAEVLRAIRRRSLARLRQEVEPVPVETLARFTPSWQSVGGRLRGADGVLTRRRAAGRSPGAGQRAGDARAARRGCATTPPRCSTS